MRWGSRSKVKRSGYVSIVIMIKCFGRPNSPATVEGVGWSNSKGIQIDLRTLKKNVETSKHNRSNQKYILAIKYNKD